MTKGKKWTLRLLGIAALALLVSLCFMGSTMARYTSKGDGSGTLTVAVWDVETVELSIDTEPVSPKETAYEDGTPRTNTSGWVGSFTIQNNSDVDAYVSFVSNGEYTITWPDDESVADSWEWGVGWNKVTDTEGGAEGDDLYADGTVRSGRAQTNAYGAGIMSGFGEGDTGKETFESVVNAYGIFTLTFGHTTEYLTDGGTAPAAPTDENAALTDEEKSQGVKISKKSSMDIYAEVVWTSIDESSAVDDMKPSTYGFGVTDSDDWAGFSDAVDTILGMYAQKLTFGVTWTAVQASTLP